MPVLLFSCDKTVEPESEVEIITGILSSADYESFSLFAIYYGFWSISTNRDLTNCIVTVNVRVDNTIAWQETYWSMGSLTIFIFDDDDVDMGYEYRIAIAQ